MQQVTPSGDAQQSARVFLSHSHQDAAFCRALVAGLRQHAFDVWYDESNLLSGALRERIERELQAREHFVVVLSPAAVASEWVNAEIDAALEIARTGRLKTFLPVIAVACEVPLLLRRYKRIAGPNDVAVPPEQALPQVVSAITAPHTPTDPTAYASLAQRQPDTPAERPPAGNQGIIITGGTINAGQIAVGPHARAIQLGAQAGGVSVIQQRLEAVVSLVTSGHAALPDSDGLLHALDALAVELARERPNGYVLRALLQSIAASVTPSGPLAAAVAALQVEVEARIH